MSGSTVTRLAPTQVELEFTISPQAFAAAEERAFRMLSHDVRLPGFRKGKVPRKLYEQAYGSQRVVNKAADDVLPQIYAQSMREHGLAPVTRPKLEIIEEAQGRPIRVKATVEVRPTIALQPYRGVVVRRPPVAVTEADVDRGLHELAKEHATLVPVQRAAKIGDVVTLDFAGSIDGEAFDGGTASGQTAELSETAFIPGFVAGICGMRPGETQNIEGRFPDDYANAAVAAKTAIFAVTLQDVKEYELPPLDDAFAKTVSSHATLTELRGELRRRLEALAGARRRRDVAHTVLDVLLASHEFELPASLVEAELNRAIADVAAAAGARGISFDRHLKEISTTETELRESQRAAARSRVKAELLIAAIATAEKITAHPADIAAELETLGRRYGQPAVRMRKALGDNMDSLIGGIVRNKTLDLLVDSAVVVGNEETAASAS